MKPITDSKINEKDDIVEVLLRRRYLAKDRHGNVIETPSQMYRRVANAIAEVERNYGATNDTIEYLTGIFCERMVRGEFLPNTPTLMNAGRSNGLLCACFVLPIHDSISDIFESVSHMAMIQKAGGGTGFALDLLRPAGDIVSSSGGYTTGPMSFWSVFAEAGQSIQQGSHRRGASMAMMDVHHPDILKFINAKQDTSAFTNFNISVKLDDAFMRGIESEPLSPLITTNPRDNAQFLIPKNVNIKTYRIQDLRPFNASAQDCYTKKDVWDMIVRNAHRTGEPGVCFIERVNRDNPTPVLGQIRATNPCGEQPLLDYEACVLGSINLAKFFSKKAYSIDWDNLGLVIDDAVHFLDNAIDATYWPVDKIRQMSTGNRKIGLGVMGFADLLILMGIRYDSEEAIEVVKKAGKFLKERSHEASHRLALEKGSFPNWQGSVWDAEHHIPMRNAACTCIAPTGSISIIAGCSSGIEPVFNFAMQRTALDGHRFVQIHGLLKTLGNEQGWMNDRVRNQLLAGVPVSEIPEIPKSLARVLVTAHEVAPEWHVRLQAAWQATIDSAVSKTVNLPNAATVSDVESIFKQAFQLQVKGITVYRDQSRQNQALAAINPILLSHPNAEPRPRSRVTTGKTSKWRMGCGTLFVTVNKDEQGICEVFANLGKQGGCSAQTEATCRVVSAALRSGVEPRVLIDQLSGIRCLSAVVARKSDKGVDVLSCPDAIAKALAEFGCGHELVSNNMKLKVCDECGCLIMRYEGNCAVCDNCGITKC